MCERERERERREGKRKREGLRYVIIPFPLIGHIFCISVKPCKIWENKHSILN
jgi:hypothetical protein